MPYVVTSNCQKCRFTDCVTVCPVDCFHGDAEMLYIDPGACIDCGACEPQCPVHAIHEERQVPAAEAAWVQLNAERSAALAVVSAKQEPLPTADARKKELGY
ncbi:MAG: ferredoxin [Deltaproteobacteria bacterium RBG_16_71_12]|nr:MAG: ferredoxin [Deltaproteobacteria bacterium RBG_16_71_12]HJW76298.1 4Fe-4S binding protein [Thermoleophilia bacterium]